MNFANWSKKMLKQYIAYTTNENNYFSSEIYDSLLRAKQELGKK